MGSNELFEWLNTMREDEHGAFAQFLQSEGQGRKKLPIRLYEWLRAFPDKWQSQSGWESKRKLQAELQILLFNDQELKPQRIRRVMMELKQLLEAFLASESEPLIDARLDHELRLLKYLQQRGASALFLNRLDALERHLDATAPLSTGSALARMRAAQMRSEYSIHHNLAGDSFEEANLALAKLYLVGTLENFAAMRVREQFQTKKHRYLLEEEVMKMADGPELSADLLVELWKFTFLLVSPDATSETYHDVNHAMRQAKQRLPLLTIRQIRGHMFNYVVRTQELGSRSSYRRLWELIDEMLNEGTLHMPDGRMTFPFFIAAVRSACAANEVLWARTFFQKCSGDLLGEGREEQLHYCDLLIGFNEGKLSAVWHELLMFQPKDLRLGAFVRMLLVQVGYDLQKEEEFLREVESLGKFVGRNPELGDRFVSLVREFARFAGRLGHARFVTGKLPKGLHARLNANDVAEKIWLLEKAAELAD